MSVDVAASSSWLGGRYQVKHLLGRGGMADVHAGLDQVLGREVAIKVLRNSADATQRGRFLSEARTLAGLHHPAVVSLLDAGLDGEHPYLVLELAQGRTLADLMEPGAMASEQVARVGLQVAQALRHAHRAGVVHRDVKPSNVIVADDGRACLMDFGIAKLVGEADGHTRTGETIGSPAYLAPEQVEGRSVSPAIDIYSLGLVLLEALTARRAYPGSAMEAAIARLHTAPLIPVSLGPAWGRLLDRMTRIDPAERPDAQGVVDALTDLRDGTAAAAARSLDETATFTRLAPVAAPAAPAAPAVPATAVLAEAAGGAGAGMAGSVAGGAALGGAVGAVSGGWVRGILTGGVRRTGTAVGLAVGGVVGAVVLGLVVTGPSSAPASPAGTTTSQMPTSPDDPSTSTTPSPTAPASNAPASRSTPASTTGTTRAPQQQAPAPAPGKGGKGGKADKPGKDDKPDKPKGGPGRP
ncbi:serine/threonine-protein kinase [Nocardioides sp.]|uniref:serine/threonine-protein kinase n=1 Tax=Nocardioides sp. TaxID=35761 RepID=UPI003513867C